MSEVLAALVRLAQAFFLLAVGTLLLWPVLVHVLPLVVPVMIILFIFSVFASLGAYANRVEEAKAREEQRVRAEAVVPKSWWRRNE